MRAHFQITRFLLLVGFIATALAGAETYPSKPLKLVLGGASGSVADIRARATLSG